MALPRVIPCLLLRRSGLVKSVKFKAPKYVGAPINAIHIFNKKEVDEIMVLDIDASREKREPNYTLIGDFASECSMPLSYGGGITSVEQAKKIVQLGVEKISLNTPVLDNPQLVRQISEEVGTSSTVVCIDIKSNLLGRHKVYDVASSIRWTGLSNSLNWVLAKSLFNPLTATEPNRGTILT